MTTSKRRAKHSTDARNDKVAIARATDWITSSGYAVPNLQSYDTWPNYDGPVDIIDEQGHVIGLLLVQVKKLPTHHRHRYTFTDKGKFLAYCKEIGSWMPVLFIGVDLKKNCAYWLHMSKTLLYELGDGLTIHFKSDQMFSADDHSSIRSWHTVVAGYADMARARALLEEQVNCLRQKTESNLVEVYKPEFVKIHAFLDEYNKLLDYDLSIVKNIYSPNAWKLGIAYAEYTSSTLSYFLYPIPSTANDVAIKKLNPALFKPGGSVQREWDAVWHMQDNPIEKNPQEYAKSLVKKRVNTILKQKLLDHAVSTTLAREYLFAYIDKYGEQLGLSKKDRYTITELESAFMNYYPRWLVEAQKALSAQGSDGAKHRTLSADGSEFILYNPDCISFLDKTTRQHIQSHVASQIAAGSAPPLIAVVGARLSPALFAGMLNFVKQRGLKNVTRLYKPKDFTYLRSIQSSRSWDVHSPTARLYNTKRLIIRLQAVYEKIISTNFPQIANQLAFVQPGHKILYVYDSSQNVGGTATPQGVVGYKIVADETKWSKRPVFFLAEEHTIDARYNGSYWALNIDGEEYKIVATIMGIAADFWLSDTPLLDTIYKYLQNALDTYFKQ